MGDVDFELVEKGGVHGAWHRLWSQASENCVEYGAGVNGGVFATEGEGSGRED